MKLLEAGPGDEINRTIDKAIAMAVVEETDVLFEFNEVTVRVDGDSSRDLVHRDWRRAMSGYLGKRPTVGPIYKPMLSAEELASDAAIEATNERRREESRLRAEEADRAKRLVFDGAISGTGPLKVNDQSAWDALVALNAKDGYSKAIVDYAIQWGRLMQSRIEVGRSLAEIAKESSFMADTDGITGFMQGAATSMLSKFWIHGSELRAAMH